MAIIALSGGCHLVCSWSREMTIILRRWIGFSLRTGGVVVDFSIRLLSAFEVRRIAVRNTGSLSMLWFDNSVCDNGRRQLWEDGTRGSSVGLEIFTLTAYEVIGQTFNLHHLCCHSISLIPLSSNVTLKCRRNSDQDLDTWYYQQSTALWMQQRPRPRSCRHLISTINNIQQTRKRKLETTYTYQQYAAEPQTKT